MNELQLFQFGDTVIWAYTKQQAHDLLKQLNNRIKE